MNNQEIMAQLSNSSKTLYVTISKDCNENSMKIFALLSPDEQAQMQQYMRQAFRTVEGGNIPAGLLGIEDNQLTRKMFAGYIY